MYYARETWRYIFYKSWLGFFWFYRNSFRVSMVEKNCPGAIDAISTFTWGGELNVFLNIYSIMEGSGGATYDWIWGGLAWANQMFYTPLAWWTIFVTKIEFQNFMDTLNTLIRFRAIVTRRERLTTHRRGHTRWTTAATRRQRYKSVPYV